MTTFVAVPSAAPGGLDAPVSDHFGHCDAFTVVALNGAGATEGVRVVANTAHAQGGCLATVQALLENGVGVVIAAGMGARPRMALGEAGIRVLHAGAAATVADALAALGAGDLAGFGPDHLCNHH